MTRHVVRRDWIVMATRAVAVLVTVGSVSLSLCFVLSQDEEKGKPSVPHTIETHPLHSR